MNNRCIRLIDLQLFADAAATGGTATGDGGQTGVIAPAAGVPSGVTRSAAGTDKLSAAAQPTDKKAAFADLIKKGGEYEAEYRERMKAAVDERTKSVKAIAEQQALLTPVLEALGRKYGVDPSDTKAMIEAIGEDTETLSPEAQELDMSEDARDFVRRLEAENAAARAKDAAAAQDHWIRTMIAQEKDAKAAFPDFDYDEESKNPIFMRLVKAGVPLKDAYTTVHMDQLVTGAIAYAVQDTEKKVTDRVRANGNRPNEAGLSAASPASPKVDVANLTPAQRAQYNERIKKGERIDFRSLI